MGEVLMCSFARRRPTKCVTNCEPAARGLVGGVMQTCFSLTAGVYAMWWELLYGSSRLAGFLRFGSTPYVLLWLLYGVGMLATPLEFAPPGSSPDVFGHHEVMHAVVLLANFLGLAADCWTM